MSLHPGPGHPGLLPRPVHRALRLHACRLQLLHEVSLHPSRHSQTCSLSLSHTCARTHTCTCLLHHTHSKCVPCPAPTQALRCFAGGCSEVGAAMLLRRCVPPPPPPPPTPCQAQVNDRMNFSWGYWGGVNMQADRILSVNGEIDPWHAQASHCAIVLCASDSYTCQ